MLKLENITKQFNTDTTLYKSLNLEVKQGQFITIIGSNGSGKSTLLNLITGHLFPDGGTLNFKGENLLKIPQHKRLNKISRVYQDPLAGTSPSLTVFENLSLSNAKGSLFNFKSALQSNLRESFKEQLEQLNMGIEDKLDTLVSSLSGGQRQALSLIMALMNHPEILLLDEHTAALDPKSSDAIMTLTDKMVAQHNITTLMVTHNLNHALTYGDRLVMFHEGAIIFDVEGDAKRNLTREKLNQLFMSVEPSLNHHF